MRTITPKKPSRTIVRNPTPSRTIIIKKKKKA